MRPGGGNPKGSQFERNIACQLSLWISDGKRKDLICRTGGSGGQFTSWLKRGEPMFVPGDLMSIDPLAHQFCSTFAIECKHWKDLGMIRFLLGKGELYEAMLKIKIQAEERNQKWMLIAKQNNRPALVIMPLLIMPSTFVFPVDLLCHQLFGLSIHLFVLDEFLKVVKPKDLLESDAE